MYKVCNLQKEVERKYNRKNASELCFIYIVESGIIIPSLSVFVIDIV